MSPFPDVPFSQRGRICSSEDRNYYEVIPEGNLKSVYYLAVYIFNSHSSTSCFHSQDLISNSPYCVALNSYYFSLDSLVLDQLMIPELMFFSILITCLLDTVLMV